MLKQVSEAFNAVSIWVVILPFLAGIVNFKGLNRDSRWIWFLVLVAIPPQLLTSFLAKNDPRLNVSYNLYTPIEFAILYAVFLSKFSVTVNRLLVHLSAGLFYALCVLMLFRFGFKKEFLNLLVCACNVIYMFWVLLLLKQEYNAEETFITKNNPFTWYLIAVALYSPGRVATLALYYYIRDESNPVRMSLSLIDSLFNILLYLFFAVGLLIRKPH